jgi:sterol desaturase/sphingolipid hydroxylase (fatty acid hydroxylase superfamily)
MLFLQVVFVSLVIASFFGHVVHWLIHQRWAGPAFRGHMAHHLSLYPPGHLVSDKYRAAKWHESGAFLFTPPFIVILGAVGGLCWWLGTPLWVPVVFGVTMLAFSLTSDWFHDSFHLRHHPLLRFKWFKRLCALHYVHHRDMTKNLGILTFVWDYVFGSAEHAS